MKEDELRMNEQEKYEVIKYLVENDGNKNRACKILGISKRQINRLIIKYNIRRKANLHLFTGTVQGNLLIL